MMKTVIGVVIAAVVVFAWGFVYWGFGPYRTIIWKQAQDDVQAGKALREHFPDNGTYYVPGFRHGQETLDKRFESGPVAFVHMLSVNGKPMFDASLMIKGFFLNLVVIVLVAILLSSVGSALPTYLNRLTFTVLAGLTAVIFFDGGSVVWWQIDWSWKLYQAFYGFTAWFVIGAILAKFIEPSKQQVSKD